MAELYINGVDAFTTWGVKMGDGFLDALDVPVQAKEYIENESRKEHGKRVLVKDSSGNSLVRLASREVTLTFIIMGDTHEEYLSNKRAFYDELYKGEMSIQVPDDSDNIYHLIYKGKSSSYGQSLDRTMCKITIKFEEPNPSNRGS